MAVPSKGKPGVEVSLLANNARVSIDLSRKEVAAFIGSLAAALSDDRCEVGAVPATSGLQTGLPSRFWTNRTFIERDEVGAPGTPVRTSQWDQPSSVHGD